MGNPLGGAMLSQMVCSRSIRPYPLWYTPAQLIWWIFQDIASTREELTVAQTPKQTAETIQIVAYDPTWPQRYLAERALVLQAIDPPFLAIEHVGSTAVVGLCAKPIIDMMAAVANLPDGVALIAPLARLGYQLIETGMPDRLFLRKREPAQDCSFHLHIVEQRTWQERNERLLRDYLQAHPQAAQAYGELKQQLALAHAHDSLAYTKAKTAFIQSLVDRARDERGLPRVNIWEE
jgi:GrpB-like predicted nucleotidyltransferase (UPF0157 family)